MPKKIEISPAQSRVTVYKIQYHVGLLPVGYIFTDSMIANRTGIDTSTAIHTTRDMACLIHDRDGDFSMTEHARKNPSRPTCRNCTFHNKLRKTGCVLSDNYFDECTATLLPRGLHR